MDLNATRAAIAAGYREQTARSIGSENLTKPDIVRYVDRLKSERATRLKMSSDRVVEELSRLAFSNMLDYLKSDENGELRLDFSKLTRDQAAAIVAAGYSEHTAKDQASQLLAKLSIRRFVDRLLAR